MFDAKRQLKANVFASHSCTDIRYESLTGPALYPGVPEAFRTSGFVPLGKLLDRETLAAVTAEALRLRTHARHHDFIMPASETLRRMSTIGGRRIRQGSPRLTQLYEDRTVRSVVERIVGRSVYACSHPEEYMVINYLEGAGQTHGWHLDDPDLAVVVVLVAPQPSCGGEVEIAYPAYKVSAQSGDMDLRHFVQLAADRGCIRREYLAAGEAYLLNAACYVHRVSPLADGQERVAINMALSYSGAQSFGNTADRLYGETD